MKAKTFYKILDNVEIDTSIGVFKVCVEKLFCGNRYMIFAKQISVKIFDKHYLIDTNTRKFRVCDFGPLKASQYDTYEIMPNLNITTYEIQLKTFRGSYIGNLIGYKENFRRFTKSLEYLKVNDVKKVS